MPHLKEPKVTEPLWKEWDYKAQKKGIRHTVYSVNGDEYTGEWLDNKKHGRGLITDISNFLPFSLAAPFLHFSCPINGALYGVLGSW